jgi:hypothetical protein
MARASWRSEAIGLAVLAALLVGAVLVLSYRVSQRAEVMAIELITERFGREAEIGELRLQVLPRAVATGRDLVIHQRAGVDLPPFITIERFDVDVDLLTLLFFRPVEIERVELEGLEIHVPSSSDDGDGDDDGENADDDEPEDDDGGDDTPAFTILEVNAPGTLLYVHRANPADESFLWELQELALTSAGTVEPMRFEATLVNARPPGLIATTGYFGPWQEDDLGATPLGGSYVFEDADLSVFRGIRGTLSSRGDYSGVLARIAVSGTTETPDFALTTAGNPVPLRTEFDAVVDGTSGDTLLQQVRAQLGSTRILAEGGVVHRDGADGKTIDLDVTVTGGRLEDLLTLSMPGPEPFMTGQVDIDTRMLLPQGDRDVIEKLRLDGSFRVGSALFAEATLQERIDGLSRRGRGEPEAEPARTASNLGGAFSLAESVMTLPDLTFAVPGAEVEIRGTYGLRDETIDMAGALHLDATLSETTTGIRSFLLMLVEPFFRGDRGNGSSVPIAISGTRGAPDVGLDLGGS